MRREGNAEATAACLRRRAIIMLAGARWRGGETLRMRSNAYGKRDRCEAARALTK